MNAPARPEDLVVLLGRAAQLVRRRAQLVTPFNVDPAGRLWFPDAQLDVLSCVVVEGTKQVVAGDLHADLAAHFATWDPATSTEAAVVLEHAARCIRLDGRVGDHRPAIGLARSIMRRAGDAA